MPSQSLVVCTTLSFFALFCLVLDKALLSNGIDVPDMSQYRQLQAMTREEFPIGGRGLSFMKRLSHLLLDDPSRRMIIVGDIHGQFDHLQLVFRPIGFQTSAYLFRRTLLKRLSYDNTTDTLVHLGDIITKGPHSLDVLSYLSSNGILGVRGNHDQEVLERRSWINWITSLNGGDVFLETAELEWKNAKESGEKLKAWNKRQRQRASKAFGKGDDNTMDRNTAKWWRRVPEDWVLFNDVHHLANEMAATDYEYLLSLPLKIYVPHAHLFLVHAGMVSHDPNYDFDDPIQPLMTAPHTSRLFGSALRSGRLSGFNRAVDPLTGWLARLLFFNKRTWNEEERQVFASIDDSTQDATRGKQERAILDLALNNDPWVTLNLRGVKNDGTPTRSNKKGKPWAEIWNKDMDRCRGFGDNDDVDSADSVSSKKGRVLPCLPMSVVYGHCAGRGLDIKRWTFGLDTGCVTGKRLTALVVGGFHDLGNSTETETHVDDYRVDEIVPFGDESRAHIASVRCKA
ncbi:hypothetical protein M378DRAFT_177334 [Amanita muscaria Koide BX008]|uniref:Calcineurin-like phosphoesterase domain-containing protein n=1 Tax=Amanita muscaria (strain Koide BX008) TaxID=946122 RepID=A0A0C2XFJ8_AMAMK|nr:hypothetical protein M378DRAFT_177334 [Amanita muscaria Koide BX008]